MISYREFRESAESTEDDYGPLFRHLSPSQYPQLDKHIDQTLDDYKAHQMALATSGDIDKQLDTWFDEIKFKGQMKVVTADLERDIDGLFDDLKKRVRDVTNPRKNWLNNLQGWLRNKNMLFRNESAKLSEKPRLLEYVEAKKFFEDFRIALNEAATKREFMDDIIDEFKERFKKIVIAHYADKVQRVNSVLNWMDARKDALKDEIKAALKTHYGKVIDSPLGAHRDTLKSRIRDYIIPKPPTSTLTVGPPPASPGLGGTSFVTGPTGTDIGSSTSTFDVGGAGGGTYSVATDVPSLGSGTPIDTTSVSDKDTATGDRGTKTPKLNPPPVSGSTPTPPVSSPPASGEDEKLLQLGILVVYAKHLFGKSIEELTQDELDQTAELLKDQKPSIDPGEKDQYIAAAKTYQQALTNRSVTSPTPTTGPMDTGSEEKKPVPPPATPSAATDIETLIATPDEEEFKTKVHDLAITLRKMSAQKFRDYILANDPEIAEMHEGDKWWLKAMRDDVVQEHMWKILEKRKKRESVSYMVEKYKTLLKQPNRPKFLLKEAAKLPDISSRVSFYKERLSCRERSSATEPSRSQSA